MSKRARRDRRRKGKGLPRAYSAEAASAAKAGTRRRPEALARERGYAPRVKAEGAPPKSAPRGASPRPRWAEILGEGVLILLVLAVPLVINPKSRNLCDVKDVVLALGVTLGLGMWLVIGLGQGRLGWVRSRVNLLVLAFVAWAGISVAYAQFRYVAVSEYGRLLAHAGLYLLAIAALRSLGQVSRVIGAACLASIPVSIYAFAQAAGRDFMTYKRVDVTRVFSFLGNPTYLGGYLILLIPAAVAFAWPRRDGERRGGRTEAWARTILVSVAALLMLLSLYYSYTISGVIGLGIGGLIAVALVIARGGVKALRVMMPALIGGAIACGLLGLLAYRHMPEKQRARIDMVLRLRDPYGKERQLHWATAFGIFRDAPAFGKGYGNFRAVGLERMAAEWYLQQPGRRQGMLALGYAHNEYLQMLGDCGMIGGGLFVAMLATAYGLAIKVFWRAEAVLWRRLGLGMVVAFTAFFFQNFFGVTFRQAGSVTPFWLWLGVLALAGASLPGGEADLGPRLRELRFRRVSFAGAVIAALAVALLLAVVAWVTIAPVRAAMLVRVSEQAAAQAQKAMGEASAAAARGDRKTAEEKQRTVVRWFKASALIAQEAIKLCPYSALGYYQLAYAEGQVGELDSSPEVKRVQFEKAAAASRRALELMPGSGPMYYNLGVSYKRLKRLAEAEAAFREAVRLTPNLVDHQAGMAEVLAAEGKLAEAEQYALKVAEMSPDNPKVYRLLADICGLKRDDPKRLSYLLKAAELNPSDPGLRQEIADLLLNMKRYQEGLEASERWIALEPGSARAYYAFGFAQYWLGHYQAARGALVRALELDPAYHAARRYLAYSFTQLRDFRAALREWERLAATAPDTEEGREAKRILRNAQRGAAAAAARARAAQTGSGR